jgi:hypothetical protein
VLFFGAAGASAQEGTQEGAQGADQAGQAPDGEKPQTRLEKALAEPANQERLQQFMQRQGNTPSRSNQRRGPSTPWFMDAALLERAGIDQEQAARIREAIVEANKDAGDDAQATNTQTATLMRELQRQLLTDPFDEAAALENVETYLALQTQTQRTQLVTRVKVRTLLTMSQIAALRTERPRFFMEPLRMPEESKAPEATAAAKESEDKISSEPDDS